MTADAHCVFWTVGAFGRGCGFAGRPVLLLDDVMDSGWTLTLAARLVRQAGASAVYPFTLGIAG